MQSRVEAGRGGASAHVARVMQAVAGWRLRYYAMRDVKDVGMGQLMGYHSL